MGKVFLAMVMVILAMSDQWMVLVGAFSETWCGKTEDDCYFKLVVDYGLTMMHDNLLVQANEGQLYSYDAVNFTHATTYPADEVITADAFSNPKLVMTYNGTTPGPALHMYEGQTIHLTVVNNMMHEATTVHLHGQYQRGTPYSDGVPFVSQCPILPGQTFTQVFVAHPAGTFYYHSHTGPQLNNGLYGAFIVHPKQPEPIDVSKLGFNTSATTKIQEEEHIMLFQDYNHDWDANMVTMKMRLGQYNDQQLVPTSKTLAGINYSPFLYHAGLINGRARFYQGGSHNGGPLSTFTVKPKSFYRFRLINAGDIYPFRVTIDSHPLLVVATDGYPIDPVLVDSVIVNVGERYDVIIRTGQSPRNYLILGQTLEDGVQHIAEAVLNYNGVPPDQEPPPIPASNNVKRVLNCPFSYFPKNESTYCHNLDRIRSNNPDSDLLQPGSNFQEYFMNFAFPGTTETPGSVNGRAFVNPPVSVITQPHHDTMTCSRADCGPDKVCHCPYSVSVKRDAVVQLVFSNIGSGQGWDHPIHLHGHGFQVAKLVYPTYDTTTGKFLNQTEDIRCDGPFCNEATWKDPSWANGNVPNLTQTRVPVKDNIIVPSGGYAVVRFKADNPGLWIVHCHIGIHLTDGMAALVKEDKPNWPKRPKNFPTCHNYIPGHPIKTKSSAAATTTRTMTRAGNLIQAAVITLALVVGRG